MSAPTESDFNFLLCCLKHSPGKPDFHPIAAELGLPKYMTAYHRHWNIMRKAGITGNTGKGRKPGNSTAKGNGTPTRSKKRPKPREEVEEDEKDDTKELKPRTDDGSDGEAQEQETPTKKVKLAAAKEVEHEEEAEVREELA